jgi:hypothetical protein
MEIGKYVFGKKHGKLAHWKNLAHKIIYDMLGVRSSKPM